MKNHYSKQFLTLLKAGLWSESYTEVLIDPLDDNGWAFVYNLSKIHAVEGIVFEGVLKLPVDLMPKMALRLQWTARIDHIERYNLSMQKALVDLQDVYNKNGISCVLLKGFGLARNYIKPLMRSSGDVDLYFNDFKDYTNANTLIKSHNIEVKKGDHTSSFFNYKGFEFEHHTKMIDLFNPFITNSIKELISDESNCKEYISVGSSTIEIPSYTLMQVQANAHILKHFIGFGIGLRQFCDIARLCYKMPTDFMGYKLKAIFNNLKIGGWMNLVYSLLVNHLGLDKKYLPYEIEFVKNTDWFFSEILTHGNFGYYDYNLSFERDKSAVKSLKVYLNRTVTHITKAFVYAPNEVIAYPFSKIITKILK